MQKLLPIVLLCAVGCTGKYVRPTTDEKVEITPERVARGEYLVNTLAGCGMCHSTRDSTHIMTPENMTEGESTVNYLAGSNYFKIEEMDLGMSFPNITPHEDGIGGWTDDQVMRAIRDQINKDDELMFPFMPVTFKVMSDQDVRAIVAYLRSVPPRPDPFPEMEAEVPGMMKFAIKTMGVAHSEPAIDVPHPDETDPVAYGEYLVNMAHCNVCHSLEGMGARDKDDRYMGGSDDPFVEAGEVFAPNLTNHETGIKNYTDEQVKESIRLGRKFNGEPMAPPMSMVITHAANMNEEDLDAVVAWLRSLPPVDQKVADPVYNEPTAKYLASVKEAWAAQEAAESEEPSDETSDPPEETPEEAAPAEGSDAATEEAAPADGA